MRHLLATFILTGATYLTPLQGQAADSSASQTAPTFADMKAHRLARLQQEFACVEAATSMEALHACAPPPPPDGRPTGPPPLTSQP
jgi:hypothetical protein